ncbi:MAG TPA: MobF family relaxase, partial [Pseudonocardiaceae bacterium]|nr:MobF family relaxase [Pseudonocardiaceae bacterium]
MLSISRGHSAAYLLDAVAAGRENYYTGAVAEGEPPGRWYGAGAARLGLTGFVDAQNMEALFEHFVDPADPAFGDPGGWGEASKLGHAGRAYLSAEKLYAQALAAEPHADPERREELRLEASKSERHNVAFLDATFSVQKSVTVLHTAFEAQEVKARNAGRLEEAQAWGRYKQAVEEAIWAGNRAALDYLSDNAGYCRVGKHGGAGGRYADAHQWTIASFFQHDSRDRDPQLHIHNAILNRVQGPDGVWRTLDGRSLFAYRPAAAAVGERVLEEHLTRVLGVRFASRPDGKAREVVGIPQQVMDLFSSRRRAITAKTADLVAAFEAAHGQAPNALQLDRLQRAATMATRKSKTHDGETTAQRLARVEAQLWAELGSGLAEVAHGVLELRGAPPPAVAWSAREVIETALAAVQEKQASWTPPDLTREISNALPDTLGVTDGRAIAALLDSLTAQALLLAVPLDAEKPGDEVLPTGLRVANGRSAFDAPGRRRYATPEHLHTERLLQAATVVRDGAVATRSEDARRFLAQLREEGLTLGADQAAAVQGVLTSGALVESLVGPAGTGKSFVVGSLAKAWQDPAMWAGAQRRVFGLATAQIAADVLTGEGVTAANTTAWLGSQQRLSAGRAVDGDTAWQLRVGDLVVVDESSMADTTVLAAIYRRVKAAGAKLLLVGDHRQLGAVGAGGGMEMLADAGNVYELADARRFTNRWEREASLRLRACDPMVLGEYHKNGRILDGGAAEQTEHKAGQAWLADTLAGKHALLIVDTNQQATR